MNKDFDSKKYKEENDNIKLNNSQKQILLNKMREADKQAELDRFEKPQSVKANYGRWIKATAVSLAVVLLGGAVCFGFSKFGTGKNNGFSIVASAADINDSTPDSEKANDTGLLTKDNPVALECNILTSSFLQEFTDEGVIPYLNENGKQDIFFEFSLSKFNIKGEDIKNVKIKSNTDYVYFCIYKEDFNAVNGELSHSNYTSDELMKYLEGKTNNDQIAFCDEFTYNNNDGSDNIVLSNHIELIGESNRQNKDIDYATEKFWEIGSQIDEEKPNLSKNSGAIPEVINDLYEQQSKYYDKIISDTLNGATIEITVTFENNTQETQLIELGYEKEVESNGDGMYWITAKLVEEK